MRIWHFCKILWRKRTTNPGAIKNIQNRSCRCHADPEVALWIVTKLRNGLRPGFIELLASRRICKKRGFASLQTLRISITTLLMSVPTVALSFVVIEASKLYQFHELMTIGFSNLHLVLQEAKNSWFLSLFFSLTRPTVNGLATCIKSCNEKKPLKNLHLLHLHQLLQFTFEKSCKRGLTNLPRRCTMTPC